MTNKEINNKHNFYYYVLKYFYSWYILPMVLFHELSHIIVGKLTRLTILNIKIFRMKGDFPLWNGAVNFKFEKYSYKWLFTLYAPLLLLIPIFFMFINTIMLYIGIYMISTLIIYKKRIYWLSLPSIPDLNYKMRVQYYSYLIDNVGEYKFNHYYSTGRLYSLVQFRKLKTEKEYFNEKINKNILNKIKKYIYKIKLK